MNIRELQKNWDAFGRTDPLWSILTWRRKKGNKWELHEFFETGVVEIEEILRYIDSLARDTPKRKALDFGCGVGRLTQALCGHFDEVHGVDIAPSMVELAEKYNRHGGRCKYWLNARDDLTVFEDNTFDFIYSNITLQHIEPAYTRKYIQEFIRVLAPNGIIVFQLPSELVKSWHIRLLRYTRRAMTSLVNMLRAIHGKRRPVMEAYGIERGEVIRLVEENDAMILDIQENRNGGRDWISFRYCLTKLCNPA